MIEGVASSVTQRTSPHIASPTENAEEERSWVKRWWCLHKADKCLYSSADSHTEVQMVCSRPHIITVHNGIGFDVSMYYWSLHQNQDSEHACHP